MPRFDWIERTPLWKVFWLYGVIPSNLLWAALLWTLRQPAPHVAATGTLLAVILIYTAWIVIAVWQTAFNVGSRTDRGMGDQYRAAGLLPRIAIAAMTLLQ